MCRSSTDGGRRCGCDSSAARQSRRVAERVRASASNTPSASAPTIEDDSSPGQNIPPSIETIKAQAQDVSALVNRMRAGLVTPREAEKAVTSLGESITQRADADAYEPNIDEEANSLVVFAAEKNKESNELIKKIHPIVAKQKVLNSLFRTKTISKESYEKQWDELVEERKTVEEERQAIKQEITDRAAKVNQHKENLANAYRSILGEIRDMGGSLEDLSPQSHKPSVRILQSAMENFPADWISDSNDCSDRPFRIKKTVARAHYNHGVIQEGKKEFIAPDFVHAPKGWTPPAGDPFFAGWTKLSDIEDENPDSRYYISRIERSVYRTGDSRETWVAPKYQAVLAIHDAPPKGRGWERIEMPGSHFNGRTGQFEGEPKTIYRREKKTRKTLSLSSESELTISENESIEEFTRPGYATATHEFSHRAEAVRPHLRTLEQSFLNRRTTLPSGEREKKQYYSGRGREIELVRPDGFAHKYMGKEYSDGSTEILSTGTESLFSGSFGGLKGLDNYKEDRDMRNFVLGTLASA